MCACVCVVEGVGEVVFFLIIISGQLQQKILFTSRDLSEIGSRIVVAIVVDTAVTTDDIAWDASTDTEQHVVVVVAVAEHVDGSFVLGAFAVRVQCDVE